MKNDADIHGSPLMKPTNFGYHLNFPLAPPFELECQRLLDT